MWLGFCCPTHTHANPLLFLVTVSTCKYYFYFTNLNYLSSQAPTPQQREMMEEAAARIAQDNCELACCFIQKTAVEKAGPEMDKRLATVSLFKH